MGILTFKAPAVVVESIGKSTKRLLGKTQRGTGIQWESRSGGEEIFKMRISWRPRDTVTSEGTFKLRNQEKNLGAL